jgi:hypothetical protein
VFGQRCLGLGRFESGINELQYSKSVWSKTDNWGNYCSNLMFISVQSLTPVIYAAKHSETSRRILPDVDALYCLLRTVYPGAEVESIHMGHIHTTLWYRRLNFLNYSALDLANMPRCCNQNIREMAPQLRQEPLLVILLQPYSLSKGSWASGLAWLTCPMDCHELPVENAGIFSAGKQS